MVISPVIARLHGIEKSCNSLQYVAKTFYYKRKKPFGGVVLILAIDRNIIAIA